MNLAKLELVYCLDGAKANELHSIRDKIPSSVGTKVSEMDTSRRYSRESGRAIF